MGMARWERERRWRGGWRMNLDLRLGSFGMMGWSLSLSLPLSGSVARDGRDAVLGAADSNLGIRSFTS